MSLASSTKLSTVSDVTPVHAPDPSSVADPFDNDPVNVTFPIEVTLNTSAAADPAAISFNMKSNDSLVAVVSVDTDSNIVPISLLPALVSVINSKPVPIPIAGVPVVVCFSEKFCILLVKALTAIITGLVPSYKKAASSLVPTVKAPDADTVVPSTPVLK